MFWIDLPDLTASVDNIQVQRGAGTSSNGAGLSAQGEGLRAKGRKGRRRCILKGPRDLETQGLKVSRLKLKTCIVLAIAFALLFSGMWIILDRPPVPGCDSFITSLSIIATWMLARKIYEHWFLWIVVNAASVVLFTIRGLYPTVILYLVYLLMSFAGLKVWKRSLLNITSTLNPTY